MPLKTPFDRPPHIIWDFDQNLPMGHIRGSPLFWEFLADVDAIINGHLRLFVCHICGVKNPNFAHRLWDIMKVDHFYLPNASESSL
jgi:hypothetical protein